MTTWVSSEKMAPDSFSYKKKQKEKAVIVVGVLISNKLPACNILSCLIIFGMAHIILILKLIPAVHGTGGLKHSWETTQVT